MQSYFSHLVHKLYKASLRYRVVGGTSTQDHTSAHAQDGDAEAVAGQFMVPLVITRSLSSHVPETPKPMIRAITTARMIMTVVVLFGEKRKDNITMQPPSFHTLHLRCAFAEPPAGRRSRRVSHKPKTRWTSEAHDHSSDEHLGGHSLSKVGDHGAGGEKTWALSL